MKGGSIEDLTEIVRQLSKELIILNKNLHESHNPQIKIILQKKILETSNQLKVLSEALTILKTPIKQSISSKSIIDNELSSKSKSQSSKITRTVRSLSFSRKKKASGKNKHKKLRRKKTNKKK